ncbi:DUF4232 domain-containing protein [Streptomyces justiciae]|uniref:DUF4232 domain-containing protein n=1 Tax=Streptomyces justiciae TaxID=2780140 RepID=A0ABU3LP19_9ACTN|nr:DUF4232 domain-containing protein [Streptomyces justiciae]MDT7840980.1 DUF4232 domain-containing protein [Streptomyces justiciae]
MGAARTRLKTYALGAAAVVALLASTACEAGGGTDDAAASATPSSASDASSSAPSAPGTVTPGSDDENAGGEAGATEDAGEEARPCTDSDVSVVTKVYPHDEARHLLLTATNISDSTCTLYLYPYVSFGDGAVEQIGPMESKPKKLATVAPGGKGYAGLLLWRADEETTAVKSMTIGFVDIENVEAGVAQLAVEFPDGTDFLNVGDPAVSATPQVTYWNTDLAATEKFMFAR